MRNLMIYSLALMLLLLPSCAGRSEPQIDTITENVSLFYGSAGNEELVSEERQITYNAGDDKYKAVLEELIEGTANQDFIANIDKDTGVYGTIKQNNDLIINLTQDFLSFGGSVAEVVAVGSIVSTLTQFDEINRVKMLVEGEEYIGPSGEPRGFMEPFDPAASENITVVLYFANEQATAVAGETRTITIPPAATRENILELVLNELIVGPRQLILFRTIPAEVKVLAVNIEERTAHVDFSEEMHTRHWGGAAGESMTINSIVNSLTEFTYIQQVGMTVAGEPMNIEHAILTEPIPRNENMIER